MQKKRILFGAAYSIIEPLGLLHLAGLARDLGWERKISLVKDHNFTHFFETVRDFKPDIIGFNIYTGNHVQTFQAFEHLKKDFPNIATIVGGPHATYFPSDSLAHSDYVVMSEGFGALRKILSGQTKPGILPMLGTEHFPLPDRQTFYQDYPEHANSKIKSMITMTGCPYSCTYCYNSSGPEDIKEGIPLEIFEQIAQKWGMGGRLFPHNVRSVDDVIRECSEIAERWPTHVIYSQDDVHGFDVKKDGWMEQFAKRWKKEVGIPYHAQMRWEMANPRTDGKRRLDLLREAGCFGLTLAIEAADATIRKEVLDRAMPENLMFTGMQALMERGFKVRTEQISGLPYGATTHPTAMNLDADLALVELNVRLRKETGGPTMAWASTLAPYARTKLGSYCEQYGHYSGDNHDVPDTFFERSVLRFPQEWIGPKLEQRKQDPQIWLPDSELERYRDQNAELRRLFNFFTLVPEGHKLAERYLKNTDSFSYERLSRETETHLRTLPDQEAHMQLAHITSFRNRCSSLATTPEEEQCIHTLAPYFGCLPKGERAAERFLHYARSKGGLTSKNLSTATRHHLYEEVLYETHDSSIIQADKHAFGIEEQGRHISKL